jgi:predicted NUDIX family NTP pyrophosphohydrolase
VELAPITQKSGKIVHAWGVAGNCDPSHIQSNTFSMEWPPHSGRMGTFPEVDRAAFFNLEQAKVRILPAQVPLLDELLQKLGCGR